MADRSVRKTSILKNTDANNMNQTIASEMNRRVSFSKVRTVQHFDIEYPASQQHPKSEYFIMSSISSSDEATKNSARSSPGIESNREHVPMEVLNMKKLQESTGAYSSADETLVSQNSIRDSFIVPDQKPSCIETFFGHRRPNDDMKQDNSDSMTNGTATFMGVMVSRQQKIKNVSRQPIEVLDGTLDEKASAGQAPVVVAGDTMLERKESRAVPMVSTTMNFNESGESSPSASGEVITEYVNPEAFQSFEMTKEMSSLVTIYEDDVVIQQSFATQPTQFVSEGPRVLQHRLYGDFDQTSEAWDATEEMETRSLQPQESRLVGHAPVHSPKLTCIVPTTPVKTDSTVVSTSRNVSILSESILTREPEQSCLPTKQARSNQTMDSPTTVSNMSVDIPTVIQGGSRPSFHKYQPLRGASNYRKDFGNTPKTLAERMSTSFRNVDIPVRLIPIFTPIAIPRVLETVQRRSTALSSILMNGKTPRQSTSIQTSVEVSPMYGPVSLKSINHIRWFQGLKKPDSTWLDNDDQWPEWNPLPEDYLDTHGPTAGKKKADLQREADRIVVRTINKHAGNMDKVRIDLFEMGKAHVESIHPYRDKMWALAKEYEENVKHYNSRVDVHNQLVKKIDEKKHAEIEEFIADNKSQIQAVIDEWNTE